MAETKALGEIDFDTALATCGLVAGNRWSNGFFSSDGSGAISVERPDDGILREPQYFFQLPAIYHPCSNDDLEMAHLLLAGEDDW
ncbi:hypothetical protein NEMBOFW57_004044 [Staphylotrichum longicolle]|uniref:Uncharacterized protein n=1 Tax=Staphylotrichum longicolle TaxID=669026 RepID=A0AAD4F5P5_9PEZI|nr:hypothetical protein NEMBOFW57_004044 [Staphylotrichum longicolle]